MCGCVIAMEMEMARVEAAHSGNPEPEPKRSGSTTLSETGSTRLIEEVLKIRAKPPAWTKVRPQAEPGTFRCGSAAVDAAACVCSAPLRAPLLRP